MHLDMLKRLTEAEGRDFPTLTISCNALLHDTGIPFFIKGGADAGRHGGIRKLEANPLNLTGAYNDDVSGASAIKDAATGKPARFRWVVVYFKGGPDWQVALSQASRVPAGR